MVVFGRKFQRAFPLASARFVNARIPTIPRVLLSRAYLEKPSATTSAPPPLKGWPVWPFALIAMASIGFGSYKYFLPNIDGFPPEARDQIRKALWARDKMCDFPEAILHFKQAIELMSKDLPTTETWHLVGTISELIEILRQEDRITESIIYYNRAIFILFGDGFDSTEKLKKRSKSLSYKSKNKLVSIKLELAQLYHKLEDRKNEKRCLDDAVLLIFNEAFPAYDAKEENLDSPQRIPRLPHWLSKEDVFAALGQVADFYQIHEDPRYAIPLYHTAIQFCKEIPKRAILLCNLGSSYHSIGEYVHATRIFKEALSSLQDAPSTQPESLDAKATILFNLAMAYEVRGDAESSRRVLEQLWLMKKHPMHLPAEKWLTVQAKLLPKT